MFVTAEDGREVLHWLPSPNKRKEIQGHVLEGWGYLFEKRKLTLLTPAVFTELRRRRSRGQSERRVTLPGEEVKTRPWSRSFHSPGVQKADWPLSAVPGVGVWRKVAPGTTVSMRQCSV